MVSHVSCIRRPFFFFFSFLLEQCSFDGVLIQKRKQSEEELIGKVQSLQAELASSNELRDKLERQVSD